MALSQSFLVLAGLFLAGLAADWLGTRTRLPRVTLLLLVGVVMGSAGFDLIPAEAVAWYEALSVMALTMVAFLLGGSLTRKTLAAHGRAILFISVAIVAVTLVLVSAGAWLLGVPPGAALVIGAVATATAPAATQDIIRQSGAKGPFVDTIKGIVAIDDAWGMIAFSLALILAISLSGGGEQGNLLAEAGHEIFGAIGLGLAIGLPGAFLTGRISRGEPLQTEALALVFLTAGLSLWLGVSFLLAGMTVGAVIVNLARHHDRAFHEIRHVQWPFMLLFFLLAGATLEVEALRQIGLLGAAYVVLRMVARLIGGWLGARIAGRSPKEALLYGPALLPQAGVAVGMALVAAQELPGSGEMILTLTIGSTVIFELIGPLATLWALRRAGAIGKRSA
ncbi:MAG: cation:proton antiporter [Paracoccaceae bacterium]|nr:cation:proton antiporter [Paracoccaceae bacterium]MDP5367337.1 cation:proton antiporter [Paracoccaceae bacterium]